MNYKKINRGYDIPTCRASSPLILFFVVLSSLMFIFEYPEEGKSIIFPCILFFILCALLILLRFLICFFSLTSICYEKNNIYIKNDKYEWHEIKIEYIGFWNGFFLFCSNTICIEYYDRVKLKYKKTYIKGNKDVYNYIMSLRN